jgi:hypothetical protein
MLDIFLLIAYICIIGFQLFYKLVENLLNCSNSHHDIVQTHVETLYNFD